MVRTASAGIQGNASEGGGLGENNGGGIDERTSNKVIGGESSAVASNDVDKFGHFMTFDEDVLGVKEDAASIPTLDHVTEDGSIPRMEEHESGPLGLDVKDEHGKSPLGSQVSVQEALQAVGMAACAANQPYSCQDTR